MNVGAARETVDVTVTLVVVLIETVGAGRVVVIVYVTCAEICTVVVRAASLKWREFLDAVAAGVLITTVLGTGSPIHEQAVASASGERARSADNALTVADGDGDPASPVATV